VQSVKNIFLQVALFHWMKEILANKLLEMVFP